jgi:hypothetical protein
LLHNINAGNFFPLICIFSIFFWIVMKCIFISCSLNYIDMQNAFWFIFKNQNEFPKVSECVWVKINTFSRNIISSYWTNQVVFVSLFEMHPIIVEIFLVLVFPLHLDFIVQKKFFFGNAWHNSKFFCVGLLVACYFWYTTNQTESLEHQILAM